MATVTKRRGSKLTAGLAPAHSGNGQSAEQQAAKGTDGTDLQKAAELAKGTPKGRGVINIPLPMVGAHALIEYGRYPIGSKAGYIAAPKTGRDPDDELRLREEISTQAISFATLDEAIVDAAGRIHDWWDERFTELNDPEAEACVRSVGDFLDAYRRLSDGAPAAQRSAPGSPISPAEVARHQRAHEADAQPLGGAPSSS